MASTDTLTEQPAGPLPGDLLAHAMEHKQARDAAEVALLRDAVDWAVAHEVTHLDDAPR